VLDEDPRTMKAYGGVEHYHSLRRHWMEVSGELHVLSALTSASMDPCTA
jgi:hypothetical protein